MIDHVKILISSTEQLGSTMEVQNLKGIWISKDHINIQTIITSMETIPSTLLMHFTVNLVFFRWVSRGNRTTMSLEKDKKDRIIEEVK